MKNMFRIICLVCVTMIMAGTATAVSNVSYQGKADKFVFLPGSEYEETDLFENFKNVLPGDVIEQKITVQNNSTKSVRIYMRAEPVNDMDRAFLDQLQLQVLSADSEIFDAAASEQSSLSKNTLLGTFKTKGRTELTVTLSVPSDLGNEFMGVKGTVPWTFLVEEIDTGTGTPQTGDWFQLMPLIIGCVAMSGLILLLVYHRRRKKAE